MSKIKMPLMALSDTIERVDHRGVVSWFVMLPSGNMSGYFMNRNSAVAHARKEWANKNLQDDER